MLLTSVFLDAGGVIVEESAHYGHYAKVIVDIVATRRPGYSLERYWQDFEEASNLFIPSMNEHILRKYASSAADFNVLYQRFSDSRLEGLPPIDIMPGFPEQIQQIAQEFKVGIAGQYGRDLIDALRRARILQHFCWHFTQDDFTITKPDPHYFEQILGRCGVSAAESVMVGDRVDNDVIPARKVGMKVIRIRHGAHASQKARTPLELPDVEIERIDELAEAVRYLRANSH